MEYEQPQTPKERRACRENGQPYRVIHNGVLHYWGTPEAMALWAHARLAASPLKGQWAQ